jgi:uncharacterized protein (TIGR02466 family)
MVIETWFPLGIYTEDITDASQYRQSLFETILQLEQTSPERRAYPEMAWTGDLHKVDQIHLDPNFAWIVDQVETHTRIYLQELGVDLSQVDLYIQRAWPIVSRPGQMVGSHSHHTAHISAVYYVVVPDGEMDPGSLVFFDEARLNDVCSGLGSENTAVIREWTLLNQPEVSYLPVEGRILIFPAKQRHAVTVNESSGIRVSLSFDMVMTAPSNQGSYEFLMPSPAQWRRFR